MDIEVIPVRTKTDLKSFILFPWKIYKENKYWVPPLINDLKKTLMPLINPETKNKECELYLAFLNGKPAGRIFTGFDEMLNRKKNINMGFFSMFDCIDNIEVAKAIFDKAFSWFKKYDISLIRGPVSIDGADRDEYKGLLIDSFDKPPVLLNSYNPEYYIKLFEECGFKKDYDVFAYYLDRDKLFDRDPARVIEYAKKRYGFKVDTLDIKNIDSEINDIKYILDLAVPDEWEDLIAPSLDDIRAIAKDLISFADPDLIAIARTNDTFNRPIGFAIALPDYNQVLIHLNGRINPVSIIKYMWYKKKINAARIFIMFVIPEYRKKGVAFAIYYNIFLKGTNKGYIWGEGSTIGEENIVMRTDIESMGGQRYKTYRIFKKEL
jgi:GNAT superfamily N-acetyltransferase